MLRRRAIDRRLALPEELVAQHSAAICRHLLAHFDPPPGHRIGFCWPVQKEPDLRPVMTVWRDAGAETCLPVVVDVDAPLAFRVWQPTMSLEEDRYGIPSPVAGPFVTPDVLLLPLNAFDGQGYRVGYGGGFFDRTLATLRPRPMTIGAGFEIARVDTVVPQPHDEPLDWIVTEAGVFHPSR